MVDAKTGRTWTEETFEAWTAVANRVSDAAAQPLRLTCNIEEGAGTWAEERCEVRKMLVRRPEF